MKKHIIYLVLILFSGIFFAGFNGAYAQTVTDISQKKVENQCSALQKHIESFNNADFDYNKTSYYKTAHKKELDALVSAEKTLVCLKETLAGTVCKKVLKDTDTSELKCPPKFFENASDPLAKLELVSKELEKTAKLFDESMSLYLGSRHLPLKTGEILNEKGNRIEGNGLDTILTKNIVINAGHGFLYSTQNQLHNIFRGNLIKMTNRVLGTIAILYLFILGAKFIMARGDSERLSQLKGQFAWIALGLAIISIAEFMGYEVFDPSDGKDVLEGTADTNFSYKVQEIVRYFEYIAGGLMLVNALISAYGLIMNGEEDEAISKEKQFLKSFLMGTAFILLAEIIVRILTVKDGIQATSQIAVKEIAGIVNFALSFVGVIAVAMLVIAGLYYVISFGDEEQTGRAKKMVMASVAGVVISFSAYTIIRFLIV